ncbi:MAG: hypothetical protein HKO81_08290 [Flavobacteriaceae bacterium]|nr:hypothetical protein [Flavobacteriaceae bacterium]
MKRFKKIISIIIAVGIILSCSKEEEETAMVELIPPSAAALIFPQNNTECNEGIVISDTETDVLFQWEEAENASSYVLQITNLNTGTSRNISTNSTEFFIRILRGKPYSWSVVSKSGTNNLTTESAVWRFYNAGLPEESFPPFPAEAVSPQPGSSVDEGNISLVWQASDIDNDIASYTVLADTVNPPVTEIGITSNNNINVTVSSGLVYYWKVITTDIIGNTSDSQVFQFRVN